MTTKIKVANNSVNKREIKHLIQDLNINDVELEERVIIAKGDIRTNTLIKIYRIEYIKIKLRYPTDTIVFIMPSIEKKLFVFSSIRIIEFEIFATLEKQISQSKNLLPISRIASEIKLFILIICSQIKKLEFIKIPIKISLITNLYGLLDSMRPKLDNKYLTPKYKIKPIKSAFAIIKNPSTCRGTK